MVQHTEFVRAQAHDHHHRLVTRADRHRLLASVTAVVARRTHRRG
jgi:hypothetical protein